MKYCSKCKVAKPESQFFKSGINPSGNTKYRGDCKECSQKDMYTWRERNKSHYNNYAAMWRAKNPEKQMANDIRSKYGLELDQYKKMLELQDYKCSICGKDHTPSTKKGRLSVDHDHKTGKIRGLICLNCNAGLGNLKDDIETVSAALEYLIKYS